MCIYTFSSWLTHVCNYLPINWFNECFASETNNIWSVITYTAHQIETNASLSKAVGSRIFQPRAANKHESRELIPDCKATLMERGAFHDKTLQPVISTFPKIAKRSLHPTSTQKNAFLPSCVHHQSVQHVFAKRPYHTSARYFLTICLYNMSVQQLFTNCLYKTFSLQTTHLLYNTSFQHRNGNLVWGLGFHWILHTPTLR